MAQVLAQHGERRLGRMSSGAGNHDQVTSEDIAAGAAAQQVLTAAFPKEWREPPLGWDAVHTWEEAHGITLPEPYRTFIATVSDGSSLGPPDDGGLLPLDLLPDYWPDEERDVAAGFPLTEAWFWEDDPRDPNELEPLIAAVYRYGSVVLGTSDGPLYWLLIVSGPQRGRIWILSDVGALPFPAPVGAEQDGSAFLDWIERWHEAPDTWDLDLS